MKRDQIRALAAFYQRSLQDPTPVFPAGPARRDFMRAGLIERWAPKGQPRGPKKPYRLTDAGFRALPSDVVTK